jgi:D-glycero-alpha-D-manno-heptose-7-phosphate kinase
VVSVDSVANTNPLKLINSTAPIRICDLGGWTDTWFAEYGNIFNIAVSPYAQVQIATHPENRKAGRIVINAENYGHRYRFDPGQYSSKTGWHKHPLLEGAIEIMRLPDNLSFEVSIYCPVPAGASTGTSAAVTVALIGALGALTPGRLTPGEVAAAAQRVETELLGGQCGIQDQICAAYGGINYIEMSAYPQAAVKPVPLPESTWRELDRRLVLVYLGKSHQSSEVHQMVIQALEDSGPDNPLLNDLRSTAPLAREALYEGNLSALGTAMVTNNQAQRRLHPALISPEADQVIRIAIDHGADGWKVNGAGGEGGSLTILAGPRGDRKQAMIWEIEAENPGYRVIPTQISRSGLRIWEATPK